jgi:signal transduction histidine kinase
MGLRPSMLDDLGLGAALQWQAREFSRHHGVPVTVQIEGALSELPDQYRTCVYRVVQEALTNCARHAAAKEVRVTVHSDAEALSVIIQDDGTGFDPKRVRGTGLGLLGIEERVRDLAGNVTITSQSGKGTVLSARIPLPKEQATA